MSAAASPFPVELACCLGACFANPDEVVHLLNRRPLPLDDYYELLVAFQRIATVHRSTRCPLRRMEYDNGEAEELSVPVTPENAKAIFEALGPWEGNLRARPFRDWANTLFFVEYLDGLGYVPVAPADARVRHICWPAAQACMAQYNRQRLREYGEDAFLAWPGLYG